MCGFAYTLPQVPDVPTIRELGFRGLEDFSYSTFTALFGPAGLSREFLSKLHAAVAETLSDPATVKRFADLGVEIRPSTPDELASMLDKEEKAIVPLIKRL